MVVTPPQRDFGLDLIAQRPNRRLGVQVKMYGGGRPVNRQMVTQLSGDARLQDCTEAMLVTDGRLLDDAVSAARKLDIEIRYVPVPEGTSGERRNGRMQAVLSIGLSTASGPNTSCLWLAVS